MFVEKGSEGKKGIWTLKKKGNGVTFATFKIL